MPADSSASNPACSQQASRRLARWLARPVELPEGDAGRPAGVRDHPWLGDLGEDESSPAHHVVVPDRPGEFLFVLDPVLQRHHRRAVTQQRPQPGCGSVGIEGLHAEQHEVARADVSRIIGGLHLYLEVALDAAYPQPVLAQGLQVSAPREEVHLRSGPGEPGAEIAPDATRPVDSYPHHSPVPSDPSIISYCSAPMPNGRRGCASDSMDRFADGGPG
jgi:hypothetical protein